MSIPPYYTNNYSNGFQPLPSAPPLTPPSKKSSIYEDLYTATKLAAPTAPSAPPVKSVSFEPVYENLYPNLRDLQQHVENPAQTKVKAEYKPVLNLEDECSLCLEQFQDVPEGDEREVSILSKTDCNHFFHEFCLEDHLNNGKNSDCPMCRNPLEKSKLIKINVEEDINDEVVESSQASSLIYSGAKSVSNAGLWVLTGAVVIAYETIKLTCSAVSRLVGLGINSLSSSPEKIQNDLEKKTHKIFNQWKATTTDFNASMQHHKEELAYLLGVINSLPASRHKQAQSVLNRIEDSTKIFNEKMKEIQGVFRKILAEENKILVTR